MKNPFKYALVGFSVVLFPAITFSTENSKNSEKTGTAQLCQMKPEDIKAKDPWALSGYLVGVGKFCKLAGEEMANLLQDLAMGNSFNVLSTDYQPKSACFKMMDSKVLPVNDLGDATKKFYTDFVPEFLVWGPVNGVRQGVPAIANAKSSEERAMAISQTVASGAALLPIGKGAVRVAHVGADAFVDGASAAGSAFRNLPPPSGLVLVSNTGGTISEGTGIALRAAPRQGQCVQVPLDSKLMAPIVLQRTGRPNPADDFFKTEKGQAIQEMGNPELREYIEKSWVPLRKMAQNKFFRFVQDCINKREGLLQGEDSRAKISDFLSNPKLTRAELIELESIANEIQSLMREKEFIQLKRPEISQRLFGPYDWYPNGASTLLRTQRGVVTDSGIIKRLTGYLFMGGRIRAN